MIGLGGRILITGGTGFLGRAIMRRAQRDGWNAEFTVYSRDEYKQMQCRRKYPRANYVLGDVRDFGRLEAAMIGHEIVIHTAAIKFIPEAEFNVSECISVNIEGSQFVTNAAVRANVETVIGISTDKACEPVNTYGMTKALMERLFGEMSRIYGVNGQQFLCVRYGNVIGSTGSVVPLFKQQLEDNGIIQLTNPRMTRYFISCDQAVDIITASISANNGSVLFPTPRSIETGTIAKLIGDNSVKIVGVRPGEKMHEKMVSLQESTRVCSWADNTYYEMLRVGEPATTTKPFELTSETAARIPPWEFRELIEDAESV